MSEPLLQTLRIVSGVEAICLPLGTLLALGLERTNLAGRRVAWWLIIGLLFFPLYLQATGWDAGFGLQGWWTFRGERAAGALASPPWLSGVRAVIWIHSCAALPWVVLCVAAALRSGDPQWEELAQLEAGPWRVLTRVTLRRAAPGIVASALWIAVLVAGEMAIADMYQVRSYAEALYLDLSAGMKLDEMAGGVVGNSVAAFVMAFGAAAAAWLVASPRQTTPQREFLRWNLGTWRWPLGLAALAAIGLLWAIPLGNLIHNVGVNVRWDSGVAVREWSWPSAWRQMARAPVEFAAEFRWTAAIAGLAALLAVACLAPLAWFARRSPAAILVGCGVSALTLAVPGPLLSLWLLEVRDAAPGWAVWWFDETIVVVAAVHAWRAAPLVWLVLVDAMRSFPEEEWETAALAGAAPLARWLTLVVPRRRGSLLTAGIVAVVVSLAEVSTSLLVAPQGVTTLAVRISQLVHTGVDDRLAAVALIGVACAALLAAVVAWGGAEPAEDRTLE